MHPLTNTTQESCIRLVFYTSLSHGAVEEEVCEYCNCHQYSWEWQFQPGKAKGTIRIQTVHSIVPSVHSNIHTKSSFQRGTSFSIQSSGILNFWNITISSLFVLNYNTLKYHLCSMQHCKFVR